MDYMKKFQFWLDNDYFDEKTKEELLAIRNNASEIEDRFYKDLEFGTGGLRGVIGAGTNRMNVYTVRKASQGLANYILKKGGAGRAVAIAYDSRRMSPEFADTAALCLAASGIKAYVFESLRPTPELSFAVRKLHCIAGIVVTASHNPKEYNGYKAYWSDGAQMIAPHDVKTIEYVNAITSVDQIKFTPRKELIQIIGKDVDKAFLSAILGLQMDREACLRHHDMKIVYTPIHGTGSRLMFDSLKLWGFDNIIHVPEQDVQSGDFPTVVSPNPENPEAMAMGIAKARETGAQLVLASDPDADRIGLVVRDKQGNYQLVNGNQIVMIFLYYIITRNRELGRITGNEYCVKTIVTTETIKRIADANGVKCYDCYTGFKWIADVMRNHEGTARYLGGGEESYGFMAESFCRDKDSVSAISLMAEIAAWARDRGMNYMDMLQEIYLKNGYSHEEGISVVRPGKTGADEIKAMMVKFRENAPKELGGSPVIRLKDYQSLTDTDLTTGKVTKLDFPATSNVLQYFTADGSKVSVRPSGTEPKIKFYIEVHDKMTDVSQYDDLNAVAAGKIEVIKKDLGIA